MRVELVPELEPRRLEEAVEQLRLPGRDRVTEPLAKARRRAGQKGREGRIAAGSRDPRAALERREQREAVAELEQFRQAVGL